MRPASTRFAGAVRLLGGLTLCWMLGAPVSAWAACESDGTDDTDDQDTDCDTDGIDGELQGGASCAGSGQVGAALVGGLPLLLVGRRRW